MTLEDAYKNLTNLLNSKELRLCKQDHIILGESLQSLYVVSKENELLKQKVEELETLLKK